MIENGESVQERFTDPRARTPWMAHPSGFGEAPDSALHNAAAVALAIVALLAVFVLAQWFPA